MADALDALLAQDQGAAPMGLGPVPQLALVPPEPVFQQAPPALPFKPAPPALPLPPVEPPPVPIPAADPASGVAKVTDIKPPASLEQQQIDVAEQQGAQNVEAAQLQADTADRQAKQAEATEQVKRRAVERGVQYVEQAMTNWRTKVDAYEKAPIESYWADKTTGDKVIAGIALAFGALGAGLTGFAGKSTGNLAAEQLNRNIDAHFARERQRIERLKDSVAMARTGILDARQAKNELLDDTDATELAAWKAVEARGVASMKAQGVPTAEIAAHKGILDAQLKQQAIHDAKQRQTEQDAIAAEKHRAEMARMAAQTRLDDARAAALLRKGTGKPGAKGGKAGPWTPGSGKANPEFRSEVTGKPATDMERDADAYASRMSEQLGIIKSLPTPGNLDREQFRKFVAEQVQAEASPGIDLLSKRLGLRKTLEQRLSPEGRAYFQALTEFTAANLRKESGAAISAKEYQDAFQRFGAQLGDSAADNKRKISAAEGAAMDAGQRSFRPTYHKGKIKGETPAAAAAAPERPADVDPKAVWKREKSSGRWGWLVPGVSFTPAADITL